MLCVHGSRADYFDFKTNQDSVSHSFTHPDQGASGEKKKFTNFGKLHMCLCYCNYSYICVYRLVFPISEPEKPKEISNFKFSGFSNFHFIFLNQFLFDSTTNYKLNELIYSEKATKYFVNLPFLRDFFFRSCDYLRIKELYVFDFE